MKWFLLAGLAYLGMWAFVASDLARADECTPNIRGQVVDMVSGETLGSIAIGERIAVSMANEYGNYSWQAATGITRTRSDDVTVIPFVIDHIDRRSSDPGFDSGYVLLNPDGSITLSINIQDQGQQILNIVIPAKKRGHGR